MFENKLLKIICSLPVILIALYFIPFIGICLIICRGYVYRYDKYYKLPILLIISSIVLLIPKIYEYVKNIFKLTYKIHYLDMILNNSIYTKLLSFSKLLMILGIVFIILSYILKNIFTSINNKFGMYLNSYMQQDLQKEAQIRKENDLVMQEKRERAKNTHVIHCPYCGSDNMLTEQTGTCKFCRRKIEYK